MVSDGALGVRVAGRRRHRLGSLLGTCTCDRGAVGWGGSHVVVPPWFAATGGSGLSCPNEPTWRDVTGAARWPPPTVSSVPSQVDPTHRSTTGRAADVVDVFVYVVVLNLFIEYVPAVISETFTLSLLTAVLLKGVLEVVVAVKKRAKGRFAAARSAVGMS